MQADWDVEGSIISGICFRSGSVKHTPLIADHAALHAGGKHKACVQMKAELVQPHTCYDEL